MCGEKKTENDEKGERKKGVKRKRDRAEGGGRGEKRGGGGKEGEEKQDKQTISSFCSATESGHCGLLTWLTRLHLSSILESAPLPPLPFYGPSWLLS